ncbi:unnamed protein product [Cuscuta epithymum]|uniref:Uncharacterized protein n=1 Tax=Cuscuta epithymum TaxID=186058 RepID=A0AAV0EH61_9ASTE|nr:unnamed protein product [Cuscuta epithymum]
MESPSARACDLGDRMNKRSKTGESAFRKNKLVVLSFLACPVIPEDYMHASIFDLEDRPDSDDSNGNPPPLLPFIRIDGSYGMDQGWGFCVLDSILYISGEKKSVYKVDLSKLSTCTSDNYKAEKIQAEMLSLKNSPESMAISMPGGTERVLVLSTRNLCKNSSLRTTIDFEIYDPKTGIWEMLPGSDKWEDDHVAVWFDIPSFTVPNNNKSLLLIQTDSDVPSIFALNFLSPHEGWRKLETYSGVKRIPVTEWPHCFFVEDEICLTDYGAYDIRDPRRFFSFPKPERLEYPSSWSYFTPHSTQATLLGYDSDTGDCEFCVVELGLSFYDRSAWLQQCVYKFNLKEYRSEKEKEKVGGEAAKLHIRIHKYLFFQPVSEPSSCFNALYLSSF